MPPKTNNLTPAPPPAVTAPPVAEVATAAGAAPHVPTPEEVAAAEAEKARQEKEAFTKAQNLVTERANKLAPDIQVAREYAQKVRELAQQIETAAGNLDGSLITVRDINRIDPARAGIKLREAADAFAAAAREFPKLK